MEKSNIQKLYLKYLKEDFTFQNVMASSRLKL